MLSYKKHLKLHSIYCEISEWDEEEGYHMGVFLCVGQHSHGLTRNDALTFENLKYETHNNSLVPFYSLNPLENISYYLENMNEKLWLFLGESKHKIKKKAEQSACKIGYELLISNSQ